MIKSFLSIALACIVFSVLNAQTSGKLSVSVTTSETGGNYAPRHVMAIWIEDNSGDFIKTLLVYADKRMTHLNTWQASTSKANTEYNDVDAITSATKSSHSTRTCFWDGTDYDGNEVADGTYKVFMELTDKNNTGNTSSFTFTKGNETVSLSPEDKASFSAIAINWDPEITVGVSETENLDELAKVYPNPGNGIFYISNKNLIKVEVSSITGQLVTESRINVVDLKDEPNGIYFFRIFYKDQNVIKKVIKK